MNSLYFAKLNKLKSSGKATKRKLADYFLNNTSKIQNLTIADVAEETDTSYATVCRFLNETGFSGFKEFKKSIAAELNTAVKTDLIFSENLLDFSGAENFEELARRVTDFAVDVTQGSCKSISNSEAENLYNILKNASQIHFFGLGTSSVSAQYAYIKFFRLKTGCSYSNDTVISKMTASLLKKGDLLFLFSSSGRTKAVIEAAKLAKTKGASVIAVSDFINTPLAKYADMSICTTVRDANKFLDPDFALIQGQITIIDILYKYMFSRTESSSIKNKNETFSAIRVDRE